MIYRH